jgi:hypothetical protein
VRFGDRVVARGEVKREPSAEGHGYRTSAAAARLELPVVVGARPPRVMGAPLGGLARGAVVGLAAGIVALWIGGGAALQVGASDLGDGLSARAVAAASPFHREAALRALLGRLEEPPVHTERAVEVALLLGDCPRAAGIWLDAGEGPRADALARTCGAGIRGDAFLELGEVRLASEAYAGARTPAAPTLAACSAHVAAHAWTTGAKCMRDYAASSEKAFDRGSREREQALRCIADALDARAADAEALVRLSAAASERAMCRVLYADLLAGSARLALFSDRSAAWAWQDNQGMDFAKGRVVATATRLIEEEEGPGPEERYAFSVFKDATIASPKWESEHRSDTPVCLMHHLLERPIPPEAFGYRVMLVGNIAQLLATLGEYDAALDLIGTLRAVPEPADVHDTLWHRPTYSELVNDIRVLREVPETGSRWTGSVRDRSLWGVMDDAAAARRDAQARGDASDDARRRKVTRRFQDVVFDPATCVPLHMIQAFGR